MSYFQIVAIYLCSTLLKNPVLSAEQFTFDPPNLKTVLFSEKDLVGGSHCWSVYEVHLLVGRRVMQDLVPRKIPKDLPLLLKYLKSIEEIGRSISPGINQTLVMYAIGDVIGAYLQAIVIPIANEAYYAGNVDYMTVFELHKMLNKWKWYLSTDGGTWSQECDMHKIPTKVTPLELVLQDRDSACNELYVAPPSQQNETDYVGSETVISESPRISIPYFDNNLLPSAVALPFKRRNLYGLVDPKAAYVLVKYYTLSMSCLIGNENDVLAFNNYFNVWIVSKVVPHLHDPDVWYPAFGAVMRIVETIKQKGLVSSNPVFVQPLNEDHQDAALNSHHLGIGDGGSGSDGTAGEGLDQYYGVFKNPFILLMISIFLIITVFLCFSTLFLCMREYRRRRKSTISLRSEISNENILKNAILTLFVNSKPSTAKIMSQNTGEYLPQDENPNTPQTTTNSTDISLNVTSDSEAEYSTDAKSG